jgi:hypothetical protein
MITPGQATSEVLLKAQLSSDTDIEWNDWTTFAKNSMQELLLRFIIQ